MSIGLQFKLRANSSEFEKLNKIIFTRDRGLVKLKFSFKFIGEVLN